MRSVRFVTYGCKANQYDTQVLREALVRRGLAEQDREADLVVVNTCTVTAEAGRKARQLRQMLKELQRARAATEGPCEREKAWVLRRALDSVIAAGSGGS